MTLAPNVYKAALILIFAVVLWAGTVDLALVIGRQQTISDWLRDNPAWFFWPLAATVLFLALLLIHLFVVEWP